MEQTMIAYHILGVRIHSLTSAELNEYIRLTISQKKKAIVSNVNINAMNLAWKNPWFKQYLNLSDIVFCDGAGVMLGAKILGGNIVARITYADYIWHLAEMAHINDFSFYFLGSKEGIADKARARLMERFPGLKIVGVQDGYFDKNAQNKEVIDKINTAVPDILIVGMGMPMQEKWIAENVDQLNVSIIMPAGAVFDWIAGELQRGPDWMVYHGFEWLYRFFSEPGRLWKRYLLGNPLFFIRIIGEAIRTRLSR